MLVSTLCPHNVPVMVPGCYCPLCDGDAAREHALVALRISLNSDVPDSYRAASVSTIKQATRIVCSGRPLPDLT